MASAPFPIKVQNWKLLCFRRDCKELVELQPLLEPHRGTAAAGQREVSVVTASFMVPKHGGNQTWLHETESKEL